VGEGGGSVTKVILLSPRIAQEWPAVQLTANDWPWDKHPSWSPDGAPIVLLSNRSGSQQLWLMDVDGSNQRQLTNFAFAVWDPVWVKYTDQ